MILFDAGDTRGIAQASKTGWVYMLDRATGKPLYGITEKPVPQDASQKTWPTQPIPANGEFTPHGPVPAAEVQRVLKQAVGPLKKVPVVVAKEPFTPPPVGKLLIYGNGPQGGVNWQPISYDQKTQMLYIWRAARSSCPHVATASSSSSSTPGGATRTSAAPSEPRFAALSDRLTLMIAG